MRTEELTGRQAKLVVTLAGSGDALPALFVHFDGGRRGHCDAQLAHLASSRRAVSFDLRGVGDSEVPRDGDQSFGGRAADIGAVLDHLGIGRAVIVGHSGGGAVTLTYAVEHGERVAGLLLVDPAGDPAAISEAERQAARAQPDPR